MEKKINIAFFAEIRKGKISGPTNSVSMLSKEMNNNEFHCTVFSIVTDCGIDSVNGVPVQPLSDFYKSINDYQVCILEGAFRPHMWKIALQCKKRKIKYIISPRSNLMRSAFKKGFLKKIASIPFVYMYFKLSSGIHFLSYEESLNSFNFGVKKYIAKNGTNFIDLPIEHNKQTDVNNVVFIGRFDIYHKGLDFLLQFINENKQQLRKHEFNFSLYGPDYRGGKKVIYDYILRNGLADLVSIHDSVFGSDKIEVLRNSKYFIHSSRYEGQPQAVLEAINCGCIPIVSDGCNLNSLIKKLNYGFVFENKMSVDVFFDKCKASILCVEKLKEFREVYSWPSAALEFKCLVNEVIDSD